MRKNELMTRNIKNNNVNWVPTTISSLESRSQISNEVDLALVCKGLWKYSDFMDFQRRLAAGEETSDLGCELGILYLVFMLNNNSNGKCSSLSHKLNICFRNLRCLQASNADLSSIEDAKCKPRKATSWFQALSRKEISKEHTSRDEALYTILTNDPKKLYRNMRKSKSAGTLKGFY